MFEIIWLFYKRRGYSLLEYIIELIRVYKSNKDIEKKIELSIDCVVVMIELFWWSLLSYVRKLIEIG